MPAFTLLVSEAPDWWERASWIATVLAAAIASIAAIFAGAQLMDVRRASQASLLLDLDARFDSAEMREARAYVATLKEDITTKVADANPQSTDVIRNQLICAQWRSVLAEIRENDNQNYLKLIGWLGFFETLGLMVDKNYISKADAFNLFKGPLIDINEKFRQHIQDRCNELGVPKGLFEHALSLSQKASLSDD